KVPTYKWVVQDLCEECRNAPSTDLPPAPAADSEKSKSTESKAKESKAAAPKPAESKPAQEPKQRPDTKGKAAIGTARVEN
ncbi:MAG: hypothetical protein ACK5TO_20595, partial [Planctomycetaceae bacterium]